MNSNNLIVFISHNSDDEAIAAAVKDFLESIFLNCDVFVSTRDLGGGEIWIKSIQSQLEKATVIISLVTSISYSNPWLLFESGAGFVQGKTVPLCTDGITVESLKPPLSLLHSRNLDLAGLQNLSNDIAKLGDLRPPRAYPGLETTLNKIQEFLKLRQSVSDNISDDVESTTDYDPVLSARRETLANDLGEIALQAILKGQGKFDIPSRDDLENGSFEQLQEIAEYYNLPFPQEAIFHLTRLDLGMPMANDSKWKKLNLVKIADCTEEEIRKFRIKYLENN